MSPERVKEGIVLGAVQKKEIKGRHVKEQEYWIGRPGICVGLGDEAKQETRQL